MKNLNFCEKTKCHLECAKMWSDECVKAFSHECIYRKKGPSEYDLYSEEEEWLMDCDVDCNGPATVDQLNLPMLVGLMAAFGVVPACVSKIWFTVKAKQAGG